jgi:hypothetical protein
MPPGQPALASGGRPLRLATAADRQWEQAKKLRAAVSGVQAWVRAPPGKGEAAAGILWGSVLAVARVRKVRMGLNGEVEVPALTELGRSLILEAVQRLPSNRLPLVGGLAKGRYRHPPECPASGR